MKLIDSCDITVKSGNGGNGVVAFRREKHIPRGGPSGGNGGKGGDVILRAVSGLNTLIDLRLKKEYKAGRGGDGGSNDKSGKNGEDLVISVPVGTVVTDIERGLVIADLTEDGETFTVCRGGDGGRGNACFRSSVLQTPKFAEKGEVTDPLSIRLELKLLADVGLVGFPNAGKSTLISRISAARPRIADYPFTTITPNLGVVRVGWEKSFVVADMPGLIEGASEGLGLGHTFLKHIERTRLLVHLIDASGTSGRDPLEDCRIIDRELAGFSEKVASLPRIICLTKADVSGGAPPEIKEALEAEGREVWEISSVTGQGVDALVGRISALLDELPRQEPPEEKVRVYKPDKPAARYQIVKNDTGEYVVLGKEIENLVRRSDLDNEYSLRRLARQLEGAGLYDALREKGCSHGDTVIILNFVFEFDENF
ncbi:MAG: GTPase ObgE [Abditibacteriota bacterium]|nr:GTPase ObgE [Abditibacteriota bacterium]